MVVSKMILHAVESTQAYQFALFRSPWQLFWGKSAQSSYVPRREGVEATSYQSQSLLSICNKASLQGLEHSSVR